MWLQSIISVVVSLAGVAVLLYNIRLSRWMWVAVAGYAVPLFVGIIPNLVSVMSPSPLSFDMIMTLTMGSGNLFRVLFVLGMAMTFHDVRRRLTNREG